MDPVKESGDKEFRLGVETADGNDDEDVGSEAGEFHLPASNAADDDMDGDDGASEDGLGAKFDNGQEDKVDYTAVESGFATKQSIDSGGVPDAKKMSVNIDTAKKADVVNPNEAIGHNNDYNQLTAFQLKDVDETGDENDDLVPPSHEPIQPSHVDEHQAEIPPRPADAVEPQWQNEDVDEDYISPDDPLVARLQQAMHKQLVQAQTRLDTTLLERTEELKRLDKNRETTGVELYGLQQQLARMQMQLEKTHDRFNMFNRLRAKAEEEREILSHDLELKLAQRTASVAKATEFTSELKKMNGTVRQIMLFNEEVKNQILVTRRAAYAEESEMAKKEQEKKGQDYRISAMNEQIDVLEAKVNNLIAQEKAQSGNTNGARETIELALGEMAQIRADKAEYISKWKSAVIAMSRRDEALERCHRETQLLRVESEHFDTEYEGIVKNVSTEQDNSEKLTEVLTKIVTDSM